MPKQSPPITISDTSPEELRRAVAAHFFKCFQFDDGSQNFGLVGLSKQRPRSGYQYYISEEIYCVVIPKLTLDFMHDVEKTLTGRQQIRYADKLPGDLWCHAVMATALQRAEAFLKTIGKYSEA